MLFNRHKTESVVSAEGFYHGSQGVGPDYPLNEIDARFAEKEPVPFHGAKAGIARRDC